MHSRNNSFNLMPLKDDPAQYYNKNAMDGASDRYMPALECAPWDSSMQNSTVAETDNRSNYNGPPSSDNYYQNNSDTRMQYSNAASKTDNRSNYNGPSTNNYYQNNSDVGTGNNLRPNYCYMDEHHHSVGGNNRSNQDFQPSEEAYLEEEYNAFVNTVNSNNGNLNSSSDSKKRHNHETDFRGNHDMPSLSEVEDEYNAFVNTDGTNNNNSLPSSGSSSIQRNNPALEIDNQYNNTLPSTSVSSVSRYEQDNGTDYRYNDSLPSGSSVQLPTAIQQVVDSVLHKATLHPRYVIPTLGSDLPPQYVTSIQENDPPRDYINHDDLPLTSSILRYTPNVETDTASRASSMQRSYPPVKSMSPTQSNSNNNIVDTSESFMCELCSEMFESTKQLIEHSLQHPELIERFPHLKKLKFAGQDKSPKQRRSISQQPSPDRERSRSKGSSMNSKDRSKRPILDHDEHRSKQSSSDRNNERLRRSSIDHDENRSKKSSSDCNKRSKRTSLDRDEYRTKRSRLEDNERYRSKQLELKLDRNEDRSKKSSLDPNERSRRSSLDRNGDRLKKSKFDCYERSKRSSLDCNEDRFNRSSLDNDEMIRQLSRSRSPISTEHSFPKKFAGRTYESNRIIEGPNEVQCRACDKVFKNESFLHIHEQTCVLNKRRYEGKYERKMKELLKEHGFGREMVKGKDYRRNKTSADQILHKCNDCNARFCSSYELEKHYKLRHFHSEKSRRDNSFEKETKHETTQRGSTSNQVDTEGPVYCQVCSVIFPSASMLETHLVIAHHIVQGLPQKSNYIKGKEQQQQQQHQQQPKFKCGNCQNGFNDKVVLENHLSVCLDLDLDDNQPTSRIPLLIASPQISQSNLNTHRIQIPKSSEKEAFNVDEEESFQGHSFETQILEQSASMDSSDKLNRFIGKRKVKETATITSTKQSGVNTSGKSTKLECSVCHEFFTGERKLARHVAYNHAETLQCKHCDEVFPHAKNLNRHLVVHGGTQCTICHLVLMTEKSIEKHNKELHKEIKCDFCTKVVKGVKNLTKHTELFHGHPFKCEGCDKAFARHDHLKRHSRVHGGVYIFECHLCHMTVKSEAALAKHMKAAHKEKVHVPQNLHPCNMCDRTFAAPGSLRSHKKAIHKDEQLNCPTCDKTFKHKKHLANHLKHHKENKAFQCDLCIHSYESEVFLYQHVKKCHERGKSKCFLCEKKFGNVKILRLHLQAKHTEGEFKCQVDGCEHLYEDKEDVKLHVLSHTF